MNIQLFAQAINFNEHEHNLQQWNSYKVRFNKMHYTADHDARRMKTFLNNLEEIAEHNERFEKGEVTYRKGVNQFTDLTSQEFENLHLTRINSFVNREKRLAKSLSVSIEISVPNQKNWVHEGAVTRVKNQGDCGACWAFTTTALLESHLFLHRNKTLEDLSTQNLIDCNLKRNSKGCCGGFVDDALNYVKENGIATEKSYPYDCARKACRYSYNETENNFDRKIEGYRNVTGNETLLKQAVGLFGPASCYMSASELKSYESGIFYSSTCNETPTDHALLIVGYGTTERTRQDYWVVKNSWGEEYGEEGYLRVARGVDMCRISEGNYIPIFKN